ncbi:helix-turn-helix domain-containing protein [Mucisphaera sp.]|uniref:helix-turn-helix domain-containing protein n=1 Tax=Mucisphaera sp. TaxID=2913024 RepID=UPI003D11A90E
MAKMFYTLEEAAEKLKVDEDRIKELAGSGQLQQFRDGTKLMFKRDQVDAMANETDLDEGTDASGGPIALADSSAGAIDLDDTGTPPAMNDPGASDSGISVFEGGEVNEADPLAQTQVSGSDLDDDDLHLEPAGSSAGSGLLDLTNESDDTSLGAELLDEIYPGTGPGDTSIQTTADSGIFGSSASGSGSAIGPAESGGFGDLGEVSAVEATPLETLQPVADTSSGGGFSTGLLCGTLITLAVALLVVVPSWAGYTSPVTASMTSDAMFYGIWLGALAVITIILGVIGMVLGNR